MFAYVCTATGWTWDYIGEFMTLPRLYAMIKHWAIYPPVHVTAALFAGVGKSKPKASEAANEELAVYIGKQPSVDFQTHRRRMADTARSHTARNRMG